MSSEAPGFYYSGIAELKVQILGEASKDAKTRADEIARNSGTSVGEVRQAQMGVIQITDQTRPRSPRTVYDISTIEKTRRRWSP